jgi:GT2 family glycosyltransferase
VRELTFEVFVVDNASADGSAALVRETFPAVRLIANATNVGFSRANNQAIRQATGEFILLLNPDTLLVEDAFSPLVRLARERGEIGAIGPKIVSRDGVTVQYVCARRLPRLFFSFCQTLGLAARFPRSRLLAGEMMSFWDHQTSRYVDALVGACMMVRRITIEQIGLMDENQFMFGDDVDWCKSILDGNWRIYYDADVRIIHYGGESTAQVPLEMNLEGVKAMRYYFRKHHGRWHAFLFCVMTFVICCLKYAWRQLQSRTAERRLLAQKDRLLAGWCLRAMLQAK